MTRGVDDVDNEILVKNRGVLREDGDSLFALEVTGVHDAVGDRLVSGERPRLSEHGVHESGLSMVYVGNNGNISNVRA